MWILQVSYKKQTKVFIDRADMTIQYRDISLLISDILRKNTIKHGKKTDYSEISLLTKVFSPVQIKSDSRELF